MKQYLKHTWIYPALIVKQSDIHNKGIFTGSEIKKGEKVMIFGGTVTDNRNTDEDKFRIMTLFPINDNEMIGLPIGDTTEAIDEYLNHSCDPNTWLTDEVTLVARRDINKGEEITLDAATWDADPEWTYSDDGKCYCGSAQCRKTLAYDDWKRQDLQEKYKGHFSPYIQEKIDKLKLK